MVIHLPRFNGVVKAVENKNEGGDYTKIGNLDTVLEVVKGRLIKTVYCEYCKYCGYCKYYGHCGYYSGASY